MKLSEPLLRKYETLIRDAVPGIYFDGRRSTTDTYREQDRYQLVNHWLNGNTVEARHNEFLVTWYKEDPVLSDSSQGAFTACELYKV